MAVLRLLLAALLTAGSLASVAFADTVEADPVHLSVIAESDAATFEEVIVEGERLSVPTRRTDEDKVEYDARPIFSALKNEWQTQDAFLYVKRWQDGADLLLDMSDGTVRANRQIVGKLPKWTPRETAEFWLDTNTLAVLTGTRISVDPETGQTVFTLDQRLRPRFGLELFVEGRPVETFGAEPQSIGPILLLPLEPVVKALGSELEINDAEGSVTVIRRQDQARITLELSTGLISANGAPRGITPNMSYAQTDTLLLPFTAVETLTGTNISPPVGGARIEVELDDRLAPAALPGARVSEEAEQTPFVLERLEFDLSDSGTNSARLTGRVNAFNGVLDYQSTGGFDSSAALAPSRLSLEVLAQSGWTATLGDYNARYRETQSVGAGRMRGVAWRRVMDSGHLLAIAVGQPLTGSETSDDNVARPTFGGLAAGIRRLRADGLGETGIAASTSEDGSASQVIASYQRQLRVNTREDEGLRSGFFSVDLGAFDDATGSDVDLSASGSLTYDVNSQLGLGATASYRGARFNRGLRVDSEASDTAFEGVFNDEVSARISVSAYADWRAETDWGVFLRPAFGVRVGHEQQGDGQSGVVAVSGSTRLGQGGTNLAANLTIDQTETPDESATAVSFGLRAFRRFEWGTVTGSYLRSDPGTGAGVAQRAVTTVTVDPWVRRFDDGASISITPSSSAVWSPQRTSLRFGTTVAADSGQRFGDRLRVTARLSAAQSLDPDSSRTQFLASLQARYRLTQRVALDVGFVDNLRGESDLRIGLRGAVQFAEPRKYAAPLEGRGVLKGRVFLDRNRDGIRQADEPGLSRVRVQVVGAGLGLFVDPEGHFTIQNMKSGLYTLDVDKRTLPLGYLITEGVRLRATIGDGRVTSLDIPVLAAGQVRGSVFIDSNADGEPSAGEERLEGALMRLENLDTGETVERRAAAFGQFSFENLSPGDYSVALIQRGRVKTDVRVTLTEDDLFKTLSVPLPEAEEAPAEGGGGILGVAP